MSTKVKLIDSIDDPVRLSFPDLFEAVEYEKGDGKPRYNASFLVTPGGANDKAIKAAIAKEMKEAHGAKADKVAESYKNNKQKHCYTDGDLAEYDGYQGNQVLSSHRRQKDGPVGVYDNKNDPTTGRVRVLTEEEGRVYPGCYVNATVEIYVQTKGNPGIRSGLTAVQFSRNGDAFSGSKPATPDDFVAAEGADDEDLT